MFFIVYAHEVIMMDAFYVFEFRMNEFYIFLNN